jgi:hypothetical protein
MIVVRLEEWLHWVMAGRRLSEVIIMPKKSIYSAKDIRMAVKSGSLNELVKTYFNVYPNLSKTEVAIRVTRLWGSKNDFKQRANRVENKMIGNGRKKSKRDISEIFRKR